MQEQFATATPLWFVLAGQGRQESAGSVRERYVPAGQAKGGNVQVLRTTLIEALVSRSHDWYHMDTLGFLVNRQWTSLIHYTYILNLSPQLFCVLPPSLI